MEKTMENEMETGIRGFCGYVGFIGGYIGVIVPLK